MGTSWEKINDFILRCGMERSPWKLSKAVLEQIGQLIPFDQGRLYLLDENGRIADVYCLGVSKQTQEDYEYFCSMDEGKCSVVRVADKFRRYYPSVEESIRDCDSYKDAANFYAEYVRPNHIQSSFGLGLRDNSRSLRALMSLDRTGKTEYSRDEIDNMKIIRPHLDNLLQNLYVNLQETDPGTKDRFLLTRREQEIAVLLAKGVTPQNISERLSISYTTVKKHIAHMHEKLGVSTRQELIIRLMNMK